MLNFVSHGNTATIPASPRAVSGGDGLLVGSMFGIAVNDTALNAECVLQLAGTYAMPKVAAGVIGQGVRIYWDDTNHVVTITATGNALIGVAADAAGAGTPTVNVRLNASFLTACLSRRRSTRLPRLCAPTAGSARPRFIVRCVPRFSGCFRTRASSGSWTPWRSFGASRRSTIRISGCIKKPQTSTDARIRQAEDGSFQPLQSADRAASRIARQGRASAADRSPKSVSIRRAQ